MHSECVTVPDRLRNRRESLRAWQRAVVGLATELPQQTAVRTADLAERRRRIAAESRAALDDIAVRRDALLAAARDQVLAAATELAPGALSADWDEIGPDWPASGEHRRDVGSGQFSASPDGPVFVRVGGLAGHLGLPAVLPLLGTPGWGVHADAGSFAALAAQVACRVTAFGGDHAVRLIWAAPGSPTDPAVEAATAVCGTVLGSPDALPDELERLAADVDRVLADPEVRTCGTLLDAARVRGRSPHPFQVLVLDAAWLDAGTGPALARLLDRSAAGGLSVLLRLDQATSESAPAPTARMAAAADKRLLPLEVGAGGGRTIGELPVEWTAEPLPSAGAAAAVRAAVRRGEPEVGDQRAYGLTELVEELSDRWLDRDAQGVRALLGRGRTPLYLELRSGAPRLPHALVAGAPGQGVTTALLVVLHTLAAQYAPDDLDLVLLSAGDDARLDTLGPSEQDPSWLPQLRVLGVRLDAAAADAALEAELAELARRSGPCGDAGTHPACDGLVHAGQTRRRVIVVDDLQRLTSAASAASSAAARIVRHLALLARRGPEAGVHLVLGTHDVTGLLQLPDGAALLALLPSRVGLPAPAAQRAALLGTEVSVVLRRPGEVTLTTRPGVPDAVRHGVLPDVDSASTRRLRRDLWLAAPPGPPPVAPAPDSTIRSTVSTEVTR